MTVRTHRSFSIFSTISWVFQYFGLPEQYTCKLLSSLCVHYIQFNISFISLIAQHYKICRVKVLKVNTHKYKEPFNTEL